MFFGEKFIKHEKSDKITPFDDKDPFLNENPVPVQEPQPPARN